MKIPRSLVDGKDVACVFRPWSIWPVTSLKFIQPVVLVGYFIAAGKAVQEMKKDLTPGEIIQQLLFILLNHRGNDTWHFRKMNRENYVSFVTAYL